MSRKLWPHPLDPDRPQTWLSKLGYALLMGIVGLANGIVIVGWGRAVWAWAAGWLG